MKILGSIEEVIFRNEQNGYTVFIVDFNGTPVTAVGKLLQANIGESVELEGEYVNNNKYGYQFAFTNYEVVLPSSLAGIEKYLCSGLIKGVGPVTAHNIVKQFGKDTFDIIEMSPASLAQVKNISTKKALEIGEKFKELKKIQNSVMFLQKYNITTGLALKIYEIYGQRTIEVVKNNPYRLVEDVDGIGFLTADRIAKSVGIPEDSQFRVRAGLLHCLNTNIEHTGNTYVPKPTLLALSERLLGLDLTEYKQLYDAALDSLTLDKTCLIFWKDKTEVVNPSKYNFQERAIAQKISLLNCSVSIEKLDLDDEIKHFEQKEGIKFANEQKDAIINSINSGVSIITGGPGTGKTTIIKCIIEILNQHKQECILLAPTGRAAKRMGDSTGKEAKTIHRALEVGEAGQFLHNEHNPLRTNVAIVDEMSMVDVTLMSCLCKALPRDCKLILVGDKDQLPSVGPGNVLDDLIKSGKITVSALTKIFRQADNSLIITNAHLINDGKMPIMDNSSKDFFFEEKRDLDSEMNAVLSLVCSRLPKFTGLESAQIQVLAPLKAGVCGIDNLNAQLQERLNPPSVQKTELVVGQTIFRVGDKVMQTANNYNLVWTRLNGFIEEEGEGVFNGDIGYIASIDYQTGETVVIFEDGRHCVYPRTDINQLSLAYAITIHKSQGSEFDVAVLPIISGPPMILTRNLIYTAVTRAKKMVVMVGTQENLRRMVKNNYTQVRYTLLKDLLIEYHDNIDELFK